MRNLPSLLGRKFGMLKVIGQAESNKAGQRRWVCLCDCGNECIVTTSNLTHRHSVSCGCRRFRDLSGQRIGSLLVMERSDQYATRGKRKVRLWKCLCDCGAITYKATDTLTNEDYSSCAQCAAKYAAAKAREKAGFIEGTQLAKIKNLTPSAANTSGVRGVYYEKRTGKWRAQIIFLHKRHYLGTYSNIEDAIKARKTAEKDYFGTFLDAYERNHA